MNKLLSFLFFVNYLNQNSTDWTMRHFEWPVYGEHTKAKFICTAYGLFSQKGVGIGHTPMQAAKRAVRNLNSKPRDSIGFIDPAWDF
jgi:hypothetical protein